MNSRVCKSKLKILGHNILFKHYCIYISFPFAFIKLHETTKKAMIRIRIWIRIHLTLRDTNFPYNSVCLPVSVRVERRRVAREL
jgi:hypothetical protein